MSALPIAAQRPTRLPLGEVVDGPVLRVLAVVGGSDASRPARDGRVHHLAPRSRSQAWRRRITALVVVASLVTLLVVAVLARVSAPGAAPVPVSSATVVVQPGETLWAIATAHRPEGVSTASYVRDVIAVNGLDGAAVDAWQVLVLPGA